MSTTTAKKPKARRKPAAGRPKGNGKVPVPGDLLAADAAAGSGLRGEGCDIPLAGIVPSPFNPRSEYPVAEIEALAETIEAVGLLQPILVRRAEAGFELVAGERRWRAAKLAGLKKIPCIIRELTDAEARRVQAIENSQAKDLSAIEQARQFKRMLAAGDAPGPTELARQLSLSQGHVSNRLRLLELPRAWVDRIASGLLPVTHARALVKFKDQPQILAEVERRVFRGKDPDLGSVGEFQDEVDQAMFFLSEPLSGERWERKANARVPIFTPTAEQEQQLNIIELEGYGVRPDRPARRALNKKLWAKFQAIHVKAFMAKEAAKSKAGKSKAAGKPDKPLTAAQRKAAELAERARQVEHAKQFRGRLYDWKVDWLRYLLAREIAHEDGGIDPDSLLRLLLYFATSATAARGARGHQGRSEDLCRICSDRKIKMRGGGYEDLDVWSGIGELTSRVDEAATRWLARQFWSPKAKDGPRRGVPAADVEAIGDFLCIAPEKAWRQEQAGPLSEGYWNLHTKDQLLELGKKSGLGLDKSATKAELVKAFLKPK